MTEDHVVNKGESSEYKVGDKHPPKEYQWQPGESGNPAGRPPHKKYLSEALTELLNNNPKEALEVITAILSKAKNGDVSAARELWDRHEGKVADKVEIKGEILITPDMRALAAREMIEVREEEAKLLKGGSQDVQRPGETEGIRQGEETKE